jgi:putative addiction module killer protein
MEITVKETDIFAKWHRSLRDLTAKIAIARRIDRVAAGNFGDCEPVGEGISELRVDVGAGYRVYLVKHGKEVVILLCGGDKKSQAGDINKAKKMAAELLESRRHRRITK